MFTWPSLPAEPETAPSAPRGLTHRHPSVPPSLRPTGHSLPDGRPLLLTMSRKCLFVKLTQRLSVAQPEDAMLLLYLCSPDFDPDTVWQTPTPSDDGQETPLQKEEPDLFTAIRITAQHWADAFDHLLMETLWDLANALWKGQHATATTVIDDGTAAQKKRPAASSPTGPSNTSGSSPEATSAGAVISSTIFPSAMPMPPSTRGTSSKASPPSPRKSGKGGSRRPRNA